MRSVTILLMLILATGCKKKSKDTQPDSPPPPPASSGGGAGIINQQGDLTVSGAGSGVGLQGPRKAAARIANRVQLDQLYKSMFTTYTIDNRVPNLDEVMADARQNSQLMTLIKDEVIFLTGSTLGDGIWAYTQFPQQAGNHFVVTRTGVEDMAPDELKRRLEQQKSAVKLSK